MVDDDDKDGSVLSGEFSDRNGDTVTLNTKLRDVNMKFIDPEHAKFLEAWDRTKPDLGVMKLPNTTDGFDFS